MPALKEPVEDLWQFPHSKSCAKVYLKAPKIFSQLASPGAPCLLINILQQTHLKKKQVLDPTEPIP